METISINGNNISRFLPKMKLDITSIAIHLPYNLLTHAYQRNPCQNENFINSKHCIKTDINLL